MSYCYTPAAYPGHPHASAEARAVATRGEILRVEVGSSLHGTSIAGTDDVDQMGVCLEPPQYVTGLQQFEQFERHTAWDGPGGLSERSGPGDLDLTIYGARKFCRLALQGNPSIIQALFVPRSKILAEEPAGASLLGLRDAFVSLRAADRYLGYLHSQRNGMNGTGRVNRPELIEQFGYDVKFAGHAVRLGVQGIELIRDGVIQLPMAQGWRDYIKAIRRGEIPQRDVQMNVDDLEAGLRGLRDGNPMNRRAEPDRAAVDRWLHRAYMGQWGNRILLP